MGLFALTVLVRVALPIELGHARSPYLQPAEEATTPRRARSVRKSRTRVAR
jgi:hypothetical protein